jgi:hypothetical protein
MAREPSERFRSDLAMIPLRALGLNSPVAQRAKAWIESMTMEEDHEVGPDFWNWIVDHYNWNLVAAGKLLDTYFFCDVMEGDVVATVSLVHDDRDVGRTYGIEGIWIGGANVRKELRNRGVMSAGLAQLHLLIQAVVDASKTELIINMFSTIPSAEKIARKSGYLLQRDIDVKHFRIRERWYRRKFVPSGRRQ